MNDFEQLVADSTKDSLEFMRKQCALLERQNSGLKMRVLILEREIRESALTTAESVVG